MHNSTEEELSSSALFNQLPAAVNQVCSAALKEVHLDVRAYLETSPFEGAAGAILNGTKGGCGSEKAAVRRGDVKNLNLSA